MASCRVSRNVIHQAISRLRKDGFAIETIPRPRGPDSCDWYRLDSGQQVKALDYITNTYVQWARRQAPPGAQRHDP